MSRLIEKIDQLFNDTRKFNEQIFQAASKIDVLADIYIEAIEDSINELGDKAFDQNGNLRVDDEFNKSLMGLQELGIQTSLSSIKEHAVLRMN